MLIMPVIDSFKTGITAKPDISNGDMFATENGISYIGKDGYKTSKKRLPLLPKELSKEELELLERFKNAEVGFDEIQREVAVRAFRKILLYPDDVKIKDWLTSELVKIKKEESQAKIGALEAFVRKLFSGNLPTHCPHCNGTLFLSTGENPFLEGEVVNKGTSQEGVADDFTQRNPAILTK